MARGPPPRGRGARGRGARGRGAGAGRGGAPRGAGGGGGRRFPWAAAEEDHCETPRGAFADVAPLLEWLAGREGRAGRAGLRVYDPFFCEGAVRRHLGALGFRDVRNERVDFWAAAAAGQTPEHDVLVTNPPFSGDNIERLLDFCGGRGRGGGGEGAGARGGGGGAASAAAAPGRKPCLLLVPDFVCRKAYFQRAVAAHGWAPLFVVPRSDYRFWAPGRTVGGRRIEGRHVLPRAHGQELRCFWYVLLPGGAAAAAECAAAWDRGAWGTAARGGGGGCSLARSAEAIPGGGVKKRGNPRQRAKARQRARSAAPAPGGRPPPGRPIVPPGLPPPA